MGPGRRPALYNCTANCVIHATPQDFCQTALLKDQIFALYRKSTTEWGMCNGGCILMKSPIVKRSVIIGGHKTSVSLEDEFWSSLKEIGGRRLMTLSNLINSISRSVSTAIFRRQFGFLCSITIAAECHPRATRGFKTCSLVLRRCILERANGGRSGRPGRPFSSR